MAAIPSASLRVSFLPSCYILGLMSGVKTIFRVTLIALAMGGTARAQRRPDTLPAPVRMHDAWGERSNSPNTTLTIKEASRSADGSQFHLYTTGVPKGTVFSLIAWPITQRGPSEIMEGITVDGDGLAICPGLDTCGAPGKPSGPLEIPWSPLPGEPLRLGLLSTNGALKLYAKLVAAPLGGQDQGCRVEATLLTPGAELITIEGSGFAAGSEIIMDSGTEKEPRAVKGNADSSGRYLSAILPYKQGSPSGTLNVTLKSSQCSPTVTVPLSN